MSSMPIAKSCDTFAPVKNSAAIHKRYFLLRDTTGNIHAHSISERLSKCSHCQVIVKQKSKKALREPK